MHLNKIVRWWLTPKFPDAQIRKAIEYHPKGVKNYLRDKLRTWVIHPLKRRVAKYYLALLKKFFNVTVVGITGSCGKTTTKEMLVSILKLNGKTVYSYANIDPIFNIPTTILRCRPSTRYLILEMGVEYPGEMDFYLWLTKPDICVITNIHPTHTEFFGSVNGVFQEKKKLVENLFAGSITVLNYQNKYLRSLEGKVDAKIVWFNKEGSKLVDQENAQAAVRVARSLGVGDKDIKIGLKKYSPQPHRMTVIKHKSGAVIIDDSYNNNPEAARRIITTFSDLAGRRSKVVIFGDMLELGQLDKQSHKEIGELLANQNLSALICVGNSSKITAEEVARSLGKHRASWVKNWQRAVPLVAKTLKKNTVVLIKGSRSIGLDNLVAALLDN